MRFFEDLLGRKGGAGASAEESPCGPTSSAMATVGLGGGRQSADGDRSFDFGWEIDHIVPLADGGPDDLSNLTPYWRANVGRNR